MYMKIVYLKDLNADPAEVVSTLTVLYSALRYAAIEKNDCRTFMMADLTLRTLQIADDALKFPMCNQAAPYFLKCEQFFDSIDTIMEYRISLDRTYLCAYA